MYSIVHEYQCNEMSTVKTATTVNPIIIKSRHLHARELKVRGGYDACFLGNNNLKRCCCCCWCRSLPIILQRLCHGKLSKTIKFPRTALSGTLSIYLIERRLATFPLLVTGNLFALASYKIYGNLPRVSFWRLPSRLGAVDFQTL